MVSYLLFRDCRVGLKMWMKDEMKGNQRVEERGSGHAMKQAFKVAGHGKKV